MKKIEKIAHRGHLKNLVKKGMIEAKCIFHYTDDYAYDNAVNYGETDWLPVEFVKEHRDSKQGHISFSDWDFGTSSGYLHQRENGLYSFAIHSNLVYNIRIKEIKVDTNQNIEQNNFQELLNSAQIFSYVHTQTQSVLKAFKLDTKLSKDTFANFNQWLKDEQKGYYSKYAKAFILN